MQTFLPFSNFERCAQVLDNKRLGKQRVENLQILQAMCGYKLFTGDDHFDDLTGKRSKSVWPSEEWFAAKHPVGWTNHPVQRMWKGYERLFLRYHTAICDEWTIERGFKDTCMDKFLWLWMDQYEGDDDDTPAWLGDSFFHMSHQALLIKKDPDYYRPKFPGCLEELEFTWPM